METLQDLAYRVYAQGLTVSKKRRLIESLENDITDTFDKWQDVMAAFLDDHGFGVQGVGYRVYDHFTGYGMPTHRRGVLTLEERRYSEAYYITNDGKLGYTHWDDMGSPGTTVRVIDDFKDDTTRKILQKFIETHPSLK